MGGRVKVAMVSPGTFPIGGRRSSSIEMLMVKLAEIFQAEADVTMFGKQFSNQPAFEEKGSITIYRYLSSKRNPYINQTIAAATGVKARYYPY